MAKGKKTGGRVAGTPNKITAEIRDIARGLFDGNYWAQAKRRLDAGRLAPAVESKLLAYAFGEPKQTVDMPGLSDIAAALSRKVVNELHPGPTKAA